MLLSLLGSDLRALEWKPVPGGRSAELAVPATGRPGFSSMSPATTGIFFTNRLSEERGLTNGVFMGGSGVAAGDIDGDGLCDLYLTAVDSPNALYRNLGGWKFENITTNAGVACAGQPCTGAVFADLDGDGDLDLLVNGVGFGTRLFLNDGKGCFRESTAEAGLRSRAASMTLALADIEGDGDLDLYQANFRTSSLQDELNVHFRVSTTNSQRVITMIDGRPVTREESIRYSLGPNNSIVENGEADVLYRNDGRGRFTPVAWTDGSFLDEDGRAVSAPPYDWSYAAMFRDMNSDGVPDLYVCGDNDSLDRIWINDGNGRFRAIPRLAIRHTSLSSMGVDFADLNRDGLDEFVVLDMLSRDHRQRHRLMVDRRPLHPVGVIENRPQYPRNTLFLNRGDGTYAEIGQFSGVEASDWSWSPVFLDVDLDGYEDLLVTTGMERSLRDADARRFLDAQKGQPGLTKRQFLEMRRMMPRLEPPNIALRNRGDLTFEDAGTAWGFDSRAVSHGMALADLDNDGDLDAVVNTLNAPTLVYRCDTAAARVAVRLRGAGANTRGIGAKIRFTGGPVPQSQEMIGGGRYLSGDEAMRLFAAEKATKTFNIEVTWRSGGRSVIGGVQANHLYEVDEAGAKAAAAFPRAAATNAQPVFREVSELLRHRHFEVPFNDFDRQLLLSKQFSQLGPGACWIDFTGDGWEDLIIGAGRGGVPALFGNNTKGGFERIDVSELVGKLPGDSSTIVGFPSAGGNTLLFGVSNYETGSTNDPAALVFEVGRQGVEAKPSLPGDASASGPMALGDIDGDGDLDLFVGGRIVPGRYPEAATSRLFRRSGDGFAPDREQQKTFDQIGLVSGAVFTDLDGDGFPELTLVCEWGPIRIFRNDRGKFAPWNPAVSIRSLPLETRNSKSETLNQLTGWWNSVTAGDFDGDGRMDLVAGNWGRNGRYHFYAHKPLRVFFGDANSDGMVQPVEAYEDPVLRKVVPWRYWDTLAMTMPWLQEKYQGFTAYSQAGVDEILGVRRARMRELAVTTLDTMLFLNRGDHFEARPLPLEAQIAPAFGLSVGDMDGDGNEDLFIAQNFFAVDPETARYDAGRGLWLRGDGRGILMPVPGQESGVMVYGEQRGCALADYDRDGRVDLVVTQNGAATKLFHNERAKPGLRVRLEGPAGNRAGIGAQLRIIAGEGPGPIREVHAGAGCWSQDGAVQVVAWPEGRPANLWVRWPGGLNTTNALPESAREVAIAADGKLMTR